MVKYESNALHVSWNFIDLYEQVLIVKFMYT